MDKEITALSMRKHRIAFLTESFTMGGAERVLESYFRYLDLDRFEAMLICTDDPAIDELVETVQGFGMLVVRTRLLAQKQPSPSIERIRELRRLYAQYQIDILHVQILGAEGGKAAIIAARLAHIRIVLTTIHGFSNERDPWITRSFNRLLDRLVNRHITPSEYSRQQQIDKHGRRPEKLKKIYNGIDVTPFVQRVDPVEARALLGLPQDVPLIGTIGRLHPQKGIEYFIEMAQLVHDAVPAALFIIVGDGEQRADYEQLVIERGMEDYVGFTGYNRDVLHYYAALDIFVLASRWESFGLVLVEAMMMQRAIVTTGVGAVPEVVEDGVTATVVEPYNAEALKRAVLRYIEEPELGIKQGRSGRMHVLRHFTIDRMMRDLHALYDYEIHRTNSTKNRSVPHKESEVRDLLI